MNFYTLIFRPTVSYKIWLKICFYTFILLSSIIMLLNYKVDKYKVFGKNYSKLLNEPNQNFIKMNFLISHKHSFDSFVFGSSRVGHIDPSSIKGGNYYNMTYSEGLPLEHLNNIILLIKYNIPIKNILIGLDDFSYEVDPLSHLSQPMRYPHYETSINHMFSGLFFLKYLFMKPSTSKYFKVKFKNKVFPTYQYDIYNTGLPIVPNDVDKYIDTNRQLHANNPIFIKPKHYEGNRIDSTIITIKKIIALSKTNHFKLVFFINPIYKVTYLDTNFSNFQKFKNELVKITNFYDFSGLNKITKDNYYFYDDSHYRNNVGEMIKQRLFSDTYDKDFGKYVTQENIQEYLKQLERDKRLYLNNDL